MIAIRILGALLLFSLLFPAVARAQDPSGTAPLTAFGLGARPLGMAGAFTALADDANALYYNPAGLATLRTAQLTSLYASPFGLFDSYALGVAWPGFGAAYLSYRVDDIPATDPMGNPSGPDLAASEQLLILSYAHAFNPADHLALSLKYDHQALGSETGSGFALDAGILSSPPGTPYRLGLTFRNLGGRMRYSTGSSDAFDPAVVLGLAYAAERLTVALDQELPGPLRVGAEYRTASFVTLRAGLRWEEQLRLNHVTYTGGLGLDLGSVSVQYAYEQPPLLGGTHRLSLEVRF
ncbi:hypothetical protein LIP_1096 [Limnochorda pilosa]|uniref:PorV/PorQ family protein n=2 Tax=Limnochorda pilosa TaxID=1555112 RepID=A0A0K2SIL4_LIMPI|nr:hypothetical protein LIP_1096 [Limnochorda pilosa]